MIHKIVLTGGPGGGKTTSLSCITKRLEEHNFKVFTVPETATMLSNAGVPLRHTNSNTLATLQKDMLNCQIAIEDSIRHITDSMHDNIVILHDRGALDIKAFVSKEIWNSIVESIPYAEMYLCNRYDAVIHLTSAAVSSSENYTTKNNSARTETIEEAILRDKLIREAWTGHPHFRIIDCYSDFSDKISQIMKAIYRIVGIPQPLEIERKFLIKEIPEIFPVHHVDSLIEQIYLEDGSRIRCRNFGEYNLYTHTYKEFKSNLERIEHETKISQKNYHELQDKADKLKIPIKKIRRCFLWDKQYFELDIYSHPREGLKLLELELEETEQEVRLPPFIKIDRDVSDEKEFLNSEIANIRG